MHVKFGLARARKVKAIRKSVNRRVHRHLYATSVEGRWKNTPALRVLRVRFCILHFSNEISFLEFRDRSENVQNKL